MAYLIAQRACESIDVAMAVLDSKNEEGFISAETREPIKKTMKRFTKMR